MSMPTRKIGNTPVSAIGFGAMGLSYGYGEAPPDEERLAFLDTVYAKGCRLWDTADSYGDNEALIGKWFKRTGKRDEIFLATKFGLGELSKGGKAVRAEPEYVSQAFAASLSNLQTDYVDLYYLHRASPEVPIEKTIGAMAELVKQGKVKYLGVSEVSPEDLRRAHAVHPIAALQVEYSVIDLTIERMGLFQVARELGIAIVCYSPLARGLLTMQYKSRAEIPKGDIKLSIPRLSGSDEAFANVIKLAEGVQEIGKKYGATPGQVALAWLLAQGDNVIPIPGTKKVKYLEENIGGADLKLSDDDIAAVRVLAEKSNELLPGDRNPDFFQFTFTQTPPLEA